MVLKRFLAALAVATVAAAGAVAVGASPAWAFDFGCLHGVESPSGGYTTASENYNCDWVRARTYTYFGGGQSTTNYGPLHYYVSTAYKDYGGQYSGGAVYMQYNGTPHGWFEI